MAVQAIQVLVTARTYLNDDSATQFPDPVLLPKLQEAHRELQEELWVVGSPLVRAQSAVLNYVAGATSIAGMPADLLCPFTLYENAAGSTIASAGWTPMTEVFFIPLGSTQGTTLAQWAWIQEQIVVVGSSLNRTVIVLYRRQIPIPVLTTDPIGILFGESFLAARTAGLAAGTVGNVDAMTAMTGLAKENLGKVLASNRGSQKPLMKP